MALKDKITADLTSAMKSGEKSKLDVLRSLRAGILEFEKSGSEKDITDHDVMKILLTASKKRKEAMELFANNNRPELALKEKEELDVISTYLPQQMTFEEIEKRVIKVIAEVGAAGQQDTNKVIPVLMKELKGKADGKLVQEIVKAKLALL
jgi:uncharacterized protein YqeY